MRRRHPFPLAVLNALATLALVANPAASAPAANPAAAPVPAPEPPVQAPQDIDFEPIAKSVLAAVEKGDAGAFLKDAVVSLEDATEMFNQVPTSVTDGLSAENRPGGKEFVAQLEHQRANVAESLEAVLAFARQHRLKLEGLELAEVDPGPVQVHQGVQTCGHLTVRFSAGDTAGYALTANQLGLSDRGWVLLGALRWSALPGAADPAAAEALRLAEIQAKRNLLPAGLRAPDIAYSRIPGGGSEKLSELRGKVVVMAFWTSWDGTCGPSMARMQTYPGRFPHWADRVALVTVNLDEKVERAGAHLAQRGWRRSHNVWAGPGGFSSAPAQEFAVGRLPSLFILDPEGVVVRSGHPGEINVPAEVEALLKP